MRTYNKIDNLTYMYSDGLLTDVVEGGDTHFGFIGSQQSYTYEYGHLILKEGLEKIKKIRSSSYSIFAGHKFVSSTEKYDLLNIEEPLESMESIHPLK